MNEHRKRTQCPAADAYGTATQGVPNKKVGPCGQCVSLRTCALDSASLAYRLLLNWAAR